MSELNAGQMKTVAKEELVKWLSPLDWDWFCTFSYTRPLLNGDEERRSIWNSFLRDLMDQHRDTLGYLWVEEKRNPTDKLSQINIHYHALMISNQPMDQSVMRECWKQRAGNGSRKNHASVVIEPYNPTLGGLGYTLKLLCRDDIAWDLNNLEFFLPARPAGWDRDRFSRRRYRRDMVRKQFSPRKSVLVEAEVCPTM